MAKKIYITSSTPRAGKSVICLGLLNALRGIVSSVGYFKPIGQKYLRHAKYDKEASMIKELFNIDDEMDNINPVSITNLNKLISNDNLNDFSQKIQETLSIIEKGKDIVVIDGFDDTEILSSVDLDINIDIINDLNASLLLIEDGYRKSIEEIVSNVSAKKGYFDERACDFLGVIVNKVTAEQVTEIEDTLRNIFEKRKIDFFGAIPYDSVLPKPRINDIARSMNASILSGKKHLSNIAVDNIITSMTFENALKYIRDGSLIITGGDRDEILLGTIASFISPSFPNVSGMILTGGLLPNENIKKLIASLSEFSIPILSVKTNTLETTSRIEGLSVHVAFNDKQKIDITKDLVYGYVNYENLNSKLKIKKIRKRTPDIFKHELIEKARLKKKRIVLPEGDEERTLKAVEKVKAMEIADIILLGDPQVIHKKAKSLGLKLDDEIEIINPSKSPHFEEYVNTYYELRKHKHLTLDIASDLMQDTTYYGTMMIYKGDADGLVSGAIHTTQHTIRPSFEIIKTRSNISIASSIFLMCLKDRVLVYGDCAIVTHPNEEELAIIAISSAETAKAFGIEPYVAILSYSTGESGKGPEVERVRSATRIAKEMRPDLLIEGPIQYDAAVDINVARIKLPESKVAGRATVFVFPDLNTGNNTYKAVQRSAGAIAIGPIIQGLNKPVNDLSRGCLVEDIIYTITITAIQAQNI